MKANKFLNSEKKKTEGSSKKRIGYLGKALGFQKKSDFGFRVWVSISVRVDIDFQSV
jgi:hypothetical protein